MRLVRRFHGPNRFSRRPVVIAEVEAPVLDSRASAGTAKRLSTMLHGLQPPGIADRLSALPAMDAHGGSFTSGGLVARAAIELQRWVGLPVKFNAALDFDTQRRVETIAYEFRLSRTAAAAGALAVRLVDDASNDRGRPAPATERRLRAFIDSFVLPRWSTVEFIKLAEARGIPWRVPIEPESFVDFGQGHRQRRVWRHFTGGTGHPATILATQKHYANALFRAHGLPVPRQVVAEDEAAAVKALTSLGSPVVVKPVDTDFGKAVHLDLDSAATVRAAFAAARKHGPVLVEQQIPGDHYRLMVINGHLISCRRQRPAHVVGDGKRKIRDLIDGANTIRLRNGWKPIPMDAEAERVLAGRGLTLDDIPPAGTEARLRAQGNLSTGGTMEEVTDAMHPDNARLAVRAAAIIGIDVAGVDFISSDITRSWLEAGGAICEINVAPGFIFGEQEIVLRDWFADGDDGRIPLFVLLDAPADGHLGRCLTALLSRKDATVCHAAQDGVRLGEARIAKGGLPGVERARIALSEPQVHAAVVELESGDVVENGLAFDRCSVLVVAPPAAAAATALLAGIADKVHRVDASGGQAPCPGCGRSVSAWEAQLLRTLPA